MFFASAHVQKINESMLLLFSFDIEIRCLLRFYNFSVSLVFFLFFFFLRMTLWYLSSFLSSLLTCIAHSIFKLDSIFLCFPNSIFLKSGVCSIIHSKYNVLFLYLSSICSFLAIIFNMCTSPHELLKEVTEGNCWS